MKNRCVPLSAAERGRVTVLLDSFFFSVNATLPIVLMVLAGTVLRRRGIIGERFVDEASAVAFRLALPCSIFQEMAGSSIAQVDHPAVYIYGGGTILLAIALLMVIIPRIYRDRGVAGAVIHGSYRSTYAYVAVPLSQLMFGQEGSGPAVVMLAVVLPIFNIMAVVILTLFHPDREETLSWPVLWKVLVGVVTNPLIVALVLGVLWHWSGLSMPAFAGSTLDFFAGMASPLALIALGGQIDFHPGKRGDLRPVALATGINLVLIPLCFIPPALLMDFTPQETGALFLLYAAPTTVSSFAMAKGMGSNSDLAGRILLSSTIFSSFTLFIGIFLLRALGAI